MSLSLRLNTFLFILAWIRSTVHGQFPCSAGNCGNLIGGIGPNFGDYCYVDPTDPSFFATEFQFCPCTDGYEIGGYVIYQGLDSVITTIAPPVITLGLSLYAYTITQTYNLPMTTIMPDTPVQVAYSFEAAGVAEIETFTMAQSQSIFYTGITSTFTSTIPGETSMLNLAIS